MAGVPVAAVRSVFLIVLWPAVLMVAAGAKHSQIGLC